MFLENIWHSIPWIASSWNIWLQFSEDILQKNNCRIHDQFSEKWPPSEEWGSISHSTQIWIWSNQTNLAFIRISRYQPWSKWLMYSNLWNLGTPMNNFVMKWSKVEQNDLPTNPSQNAWYKPKKQGIASYQP